MTVTERAMGIGAWSIRLRDDTPRTIVDLIAVEAHAFGHIVITPTHVDSTGLADEDLLGLARYTGVLRKQTGDFGFSGGGLAFWLGDEDGKGNVYEIDISNTNGTLATWIAALRPGALLPGAVTSPGPTVTQLFAQVTPREAIDIICDTVGAEWRINPNFTLDAGAPSALYPTVPTTVVVRTKGESGSDLGVTGILGAIDTERDVEDYITKVILTTKGSATTETRTTATSSSVPYTDPQGNPLVIKSKVNATTVDTPNAPTLAAQTLAKNVSVRREVTLSADVYDIGSEVKVGAPVWLYDPLAGLIDLTQDLAYRGRVINPMVTRVLGYTWPIVNGLGVYFRHKVGSTTTWTDLTPYMVWEDGRTTIEIGASPRASNA